jgi:hypothetical protein
MADIKTTTYTAGYSDTMKPDVYDYITNISPEDTVVCSLIGRATATSTEHKWPQDELAAPGQNAVVEGADVTAAAITPPTMESNYVQNAQKSFMISDDAEHVEKYGRKSAIKYQTGKKLPELMKDIEWAVVNNATKAAGDAGTARLSMGLAGFIVTNKYDFAATKATTNLLTKQILNDTMQLAWKEGGNLSHIICSAKQQQQISELSTNDRFEYAKDKEITASVQWYHGDFGDVKVMKHRYIEETADTGEYYANMYIIDSKRWKLARFMGNPKTEELARVGTARKYMINGRFTLEALQEKSSAVIQNLWQRTVPV